MRELLRAVVTEKPMMTLLETDPKHGSITREQVHAQLVTADGEYERWGLAGEMQGWGYTMPSAQELYAALFERDPIIEWNRIGLFQDVTMRMIADAVLPEAQRGCTYLQGELSRKPRPVLPPPRMGKRFHLFCSPHNAGAVGVVAELSEAMAMAILTTSDTAELVKCERMLVYLTSKTWTSGAESAAFAAEVEQALKLGSGRLLLVHEMPGTDDGEARAAVRFDDFFAGELNGGTPDRLLRAGIFHQIAITLKGGAWRSVSLIMMAQALAKDPAHVDDPASDDEASSDPHEATEASGTATPAERDPHPRP